VPLNVAVSGANRNGCMLLEPILETMPAIRGVGRGHPRRRPSCTPTRATTSRGCAATCAAAGSPPESPAFAGPPALGWAGTAGSWNLHVGWLSYKRLALRYDRIAATFTALARLAVTLICA
jgi:hypothetical protein